MPAPDLWPGVVASSGCTLLALTPHRLPAGAALPRGSALSRVSPDARLPAMCVSEAERMGPHRASASPWVAPLVASLGLTVLAFLTQVRAFPLDATVGVDSGVYAYGGEQILLGKLPYVDFWDHKPPAVYYIDALAISLLGHTANGLWVFGTGYVILFALATAMALRGPLGPGLASLATVIMLLTATHPHYFQYANLTEVYALLPQVLAIAAGAAFARQRKPLGLLVVGLLTSICFLTKQTTIGIGMAVFLAALAEPSAESLPRRTARLGLWFVAGLVMPLGITAAYWASRGALGELWSATIEFNRLYAGGWPSAKELYGALRFVLLSQPLGSVAQIALVAATLFVITRLRPFFSKLTTDLEGNEQLWTSKSLPPDRRLIVHAVILAMPIEVFMVSIGRGYDHYYITLIPAFVLAATLIVGEAWQRVRRKFHPTFWPTLGLTALAALAIPWTIETYTQIRLDLWRLPGLPTEWREAQSNLLPELDYVVSNTSPSESVLFWGYQTGHNFTTRRRSPSRYTYPAALLMPGYDNPRRWREFMEDLERDPPTLILGDQDWDPYFLPNEVGVCSGCTPEIRQGMETFSAYVLEHYAYMTQINHFRIFERNAE